jgi:hypothetical protein
MLIINASPPCASLYSRLQAIIAFVNAPVDLAAAFQQRWNGFAG